MKKIILFFMLLILSLPLFSQLPAHVTMDNDVYVPGIKSIKLCIDGYDFGKPIIKLNSGEQLRLAFDDLEKDSRYLKYTLIHCTHDWKKTDMNLLEYLDGFMEDEITEYSYSFNTIQHYIHYELLFPNENMRVLKSGNYILYVYDEDQSQPVLTRRLMILEPLQAGVSGEVHAATDVSHMYTKQEVDFTVNSGPYSIRNPSMYLKANIVQNGRWDQAIIGLKYRSAKPGEYSFDYDNNENVFNGGAEFRTFDIKSLRYNGDNIVSIGFRNEVNQAYILEDIARPFGAYETHTTLKGKNYYKNDDFQGENREDYVYTHFSLKADFPVQGGDLYVFGELTDWRVLEEAKLTFNPLSKYWEAALYLKQGYYNYQYVYIKNDTREIDETFIEGSHWETRNDYTVLVYLQEEGTVYDKLIGVAYLNITP